MEKEIINKKVRVVLGKRGTYGKPIYFSIQHWLDEFGEGTINLIHRKDDLTYPITLTRDSDNFVSFIISGSETATVGYGELEYQFYKDGVLQKSCTIETETLKDVDGQIGPTPDPIASWIIEVDKRLAIIEGDLRQAKEYRDETEQFKDDVLLAKNQVDKVKEDVEEIKQDIEDEVNGFDARLTREISRAKARENEIESKIPSHDNFATKEELEAETNARINADNEFTRDLDDVHNLIDDLEDSKAEKDNTYTKAEVNQLVAQATPSDYDEFKAQVETNKTDIETINGLIPSQASEENQLADKEFVNSSIATNTATFIGTFNSVAELEAYEGVKTNNDYAFVIINDETTGFVKEYDRYKWNGTQWLFEYSLNNSSFTAQQWATINSGLTSQDVEDLHNALATIEQIQTQLAKKVDKQDGYSLMSEDEHTKLSSLENYDDTEIKGAIQDIASDVQELQTEVDGLINDEVVELNKTWSSQKVADRLNEIELAKFPNVTIIGQPTIQQGQISNFSSTNYCQFPFVVDFQNQAFELDFEITTGSEVTQQHNIFDSVFGLAFAVRDSKFVLAVSTNGTSWNIGEVHGSHIVLPNTTYRIRLVWDKQNLTLEYSTDGGTTYILDSTRALTEQPYPKQIFIGVTSDKSTIFNGIINLNYAKLTIANKVVWQGMDDVGLASRANVSLSNLDVAGINKVKEIIKEENYATENWVNEQGFLKEHQSLDDYYTKEEVDNLIQPSIYGVSRALDTSSSGWSRTGASIGKVANATKDGSLVANDFDVIYPWSEIKSCNMTADGVVTAWYGDVNFKFDGSNGDVMTYIPPFYYRRWQDGTNEHIQISKYSFDGASYSEGFYIGRYNTDNDYKSRANQFGRVNTNIGTFRTNSKAKGAKWQQLDWHYFLLEMLYLVEYADYNSQVKLGRGYADCGVNWTSPGDKITEVIAGNKFVCSSNRYKVGQYITIGTSYTGMQISDGVKITAKDGSTYTIEKSYNLEVGQNINSSRVLNGQCDGLGMRSGCYRNDGISSVIYRGIENIFGNIFQFVDGLNIKDYIAYINYNPTTYASDVFTGDYAQLGYTNASGTNAYIKKMGYDSNHPMVGLPIEIGGAESTYITDYYYQNSGNRIALVGGRFSGGGYDGFFCWLLSSASSDAVWHYGARLLKTI